MLDYLLEDEMKKFYLHELEKSMKNDGKSSGKNRELKEEIDEGRRTTRSTREGKRRKIVGEW